MSKEIVKIVELLNERLFNTHHSDTELFAELIEIQNQLGLLYGARPTCPYLRPLLMPRTLYDEISHAAQVIAGAAQTLANAALEHDEILAMLDLTQREERLARIDPGYQKLCVTSRLDTFINGGDFKFLEYNAETPAGVGDQMQLEKVLRRIPLIREFLEANDHLRPQPHKKLLQSLFSVYRESGGTKSKPNIAIVDWEGVSTEAEFYILKDYFESLGFRTMVVDPHEIEYSEGVLRAGSFEIDILYKRVIIHELLEKFDDSHPIIQAYADGQICMASSFRVKLAHKKASFAVFTDEEFSHCFTAEQIEAIGKHIPWTRKVEERKTKYLGREIDLVEFLLKNRQSFLLKPNDDYGGKGITFGWESSAQEWQVAVEESLRDSFVVQERVPIEKEVFPVYSDTVELAELLVDFDPFLFLNEVEGGLVRLSASSLVNVTQGGGQSALIVLEDL